MSKSKTNFNTFLRECEEYESIGMKKNNHASSHSNNIFLNSKMNGNDDGGGAHGGVGVVDVSKLILNDDNFPSLSSSSSKQKSNTNKTDIKTEKVDCNTKIDFKKALASSPPLLLQQQQQQQKQQQQQQQRMAAISAASKCTLVKKESEYIAKKFIMSKRYSTLNGMSSLDCDDYDDYDDDDEDDGNIIDDE